MPMRLATRAIILQDNRLLLVNAWAPDKGSDLWCAPGGGAEIGQSLPDNLAREVHEETGLKVEVGAPALVNEYDDAPRNWHQVEIFFRCTVISGALSSDWTDPEGVVNQRRWVTRSEIETLRFKPSSLPAVAWGETALSYDPLEPLLR